MNNKAENREKLSQNRLVLALVGMPGAGKSEVASYLAEKGFPFVRFGQITEDEVRRRGLPLTQANEQLVREAIRREEGMGAYAVRAKPQIEELLKDHSTIVIDGLYSWEEFLILRGEFPGLVLIHIFAEPKIRYERLVKRPTRPLPIEEGFARDKAELEGLNKGGPIALADYLIDNSVGDLGSLHEKIDTLLAGLNVKV